MDADERPSGEFEYDPIEIGFRIAEWAVKGVIFGWPVVLWFIAEKSTFEGALALCVVGLLIAVVGFFLSRGPGLSSLALRWTFHWLLLFLIMGYVDDATSPYRHRMSFDARDWRQSPVFWGLWNDDEVGPPPRARMLDDVLSRVLAMGQSRAEVSALLGPLEFGDHENERTLFYDLGLRSSGLFSSERRVLRIGFDENDRVVSIDVVIDTTSGW